MSRTLAVELLPVVFWSGSPDGTLESVSDSWLEYSGLSRASTLAGDWIQAIHPDEQERYLAAMGEQLATGKPLHTEVRLRRRDGVYRWFDARAVAERDGVDRIVRWNGALLDIHDQVELRETLRRQTEQLEKIMAVSPGVICSFRLDPHGHATMPFASAAIEDVYGLTREELAADCSAAWGRLHPDDVAPCQASIAESARSMAPWRAEFRVNHPTRGEIWIEGSSKPQREPDGSILWHGVLHDVTQRKRTEAALRERDERLRSVFSALTEGVLVFMPDGTVVDANPSAERILGLTVAEMRERGGLTTWRPVREDGSRFPVEELPVARTLATGLPHRDVILGSLDLSDRVAWLLVSAEPLRDPASGALSGAVVSFTDITERKADEMRLRRSEERFKRAFSCGPPGLVLRRVDGDWQPIEVNDAFLAIAGCARADVVGPASRLVPRAVLPELISACEREPVVRDLEIRFAGRRGETHVLLASTERLELAEGEAVLCFFRDVTEERRAAAALRTSEARFRTLYESSPAALFEHDWTELFAFADMLRRIGVADLAAHLAGAPQLVDDLMEGIAVIDLNDRALALLGARSKEEFLASLPRIRGKPDTPRVIVGALAAALAGAETYSTEFTLPTLGGELRRVLGTFRFAPPDEGRRRVLFSLTDISEKHRAARRVAAQAAVGRVLSECTSLAEAAQRLVRALGEAEGWDFGAIWQVHGDRLRCVDVWHGPEPEIRALVERTRSISFPRGDGAPGRVWATGKPVLIPDLSAAPFYRRGPEAAAAKLRSAVAFPIIAGDRVVGVIDFLSREARTEDPQLRDIFEAVGRQIGGFLRRIDAEDALREINRRFEVVAGATSDVLYDWDLRSDAVWWSEGLAALVGEPLSPPPGLDWWVARVHHDDRPRVAARLALAREGEVPAWSDEYRFRRADGSYADVHDRGQLMRDAGLGARLIGGILDVSVRKRAEAEVRRLAGELEERVRARTAELQATNLELEAFSYSVSHDLRAPLRAVNGFAAMLMEDHAPSLPPEGQRLVTTICDSAARMGQLIDDLLTLSRVSRRAMRRVHIDTALTVRDAVAELLEVPGRRRAELRIAELPDCHGDPGLVRQVWTNLIGNALKYSAKAESPLVEVWAEEGDGETVYAVRDNGVGFDMRYAHKLFQVFQRLHRPDEFEGTGIGLAIVQRIVHRHGGRIWADAAVGLGATFYFTLARDPS